MKKKYNLKIGPFLVRATLVKQSSPKLQGYSGLAKYAENKIIVSKDQDISQVQDTLLHEVLHFVSFTYGIKEFLNDQDKEEFMVRQMATGILQVLKDNPDLVECLLEDNESEAPRLPRES